ncbi:MAG: Holliday junction branch migration protein RuvA [Eggerthellaceae bacterium]|nr:Holliday junction branch migration protein RuvA [Eggerthellaceae bacterium]
MIAFLNGRLAGKTPQAALVDVNGVGYAVAMSQTALSKLPAVGEDVLVLTYLQVSENGIALYGFLSSEEKALFEKLISVSGVGPKVALAALSTFSPAVLADAVAVQDVALVSKIPGVGKKTASRIILELKGSLDAGSQSLFAQEDAAPNVLEGRLREVKAALLSMGLAPAEADIALKGAPEDADDQALLRYALRRLGGGA